MAIRYSIVSNLSCQIVSEYLICGVDSKLRGHTDTLDEAYQAASKIAARMIDERVSKKAEVDIWGTDETRRRPLVARIVFEQFTNERGGDYG